MKKVLIMAVTVLVTMSSCSSYTATGAAFGGAIGSAIGGLAGGYRGSDVGTLIGMAAGAAIGAAAEEEETRRAERIAFERKSSSSRYYGDDDMYYSGSNLSGYDLAKRERVRAYHKKMKAKTNGQGYPTATTSRSTTTNGFRLERGKDPMSDSIKTTVAIPDSSGYSSTAKYDDRIKME